MENTPDGHGTEQGEQPTKMISVGMTDDRRVDFADTDVAEVRQQRSLAMVYELVTCTRIHEQRPSSGKPNEGSVAMPDVEEHQFERCGPVAVNHRPPGSEDKAPKGRPHKPPSVARARPLGQGQRPQCQGHYGKRSRHEPVDRKKSKPGIALRGDPQQEVCTEVG